MNFTKVATLLSLFTILFTTTSCAPPSTENVRISENYTMNYRYNEYYSGTYYDTYWPTLNLTNESNSAAYITISYSFYAWNVRQTASSLNKTINIYAPQGESTWTMPSSDRAVINSNATYNGNLIDVNDVDFYWTVNSVFAAS